MANNSKKKEIKKPGFFSRLGQKIKDLKAEGKKITWASRKSTFKSFGIVLFIVVIAAVVIGLIDWGIGALLNLLFENINIFG